MHLVGFLLTLNYDARKHELKIYGALQYHISTVSCYYKTNKQTTAVPRDLVKQRRHKKDFTKKLYDTFQFEYTTFHFIFPIGV